ncbi:MAG: Hsp70 family protein [Planctomycetaceae bacterium]
MSDAASTLPEELPSQSRYIVGIDLGTTNSAVCCIDTTAAKPKLQVFQVPQLTGPGQIESRDTLPSFLYEAASGEFPKGALKQPWDKSEQPQFVGEFAREQGKLVPGRSVESAKSWLCHPGVDRTAALLPWQGSDDVTRLSPVEVSAAYLSQIRSAWDAAHRQNPLAEQDVVITLPASFDEVARKLTIDAAKRAGLPRIHLIEEPQAAFYSWIDTHREDWQDHVSPGQTILVCDVGGGTSDFTLIRVRRLQDGTVQFHRIAVGDHLILGGDNIDLALASFLEPKLSKSGKLNARQWGSLVRRCRHAKEVLLSEDASEELTISIPGTGSKLIGGSLQVQLSRTETQQLVLEGFFPEVPLDARPATKRSGFQEFGLPYAADAGITRYLAEFLQKHATIQLPGEEDPQPVRPDVILFNGGVFVSDLLRERVTGLIHSWYAEQVAGWKPLVLMNERHDLAVARGAAYYGLVRRGEGVRISAGLPRTYYVGVDGASADTANAICLLPAGMEPGEEIELADRQFSLAIATPVEFPLYHSSTRLTDQPGQLVEVDPENFTTLPPIRTVLRSRKNKETTHIPVRLHARMTELGTLDMWCSEVEGNRSWQIQFDVRSATQTDQQAHAGQGESKGVLDSKVLEESAGPIQDVFENDVKAPPQELPQHLADVIELPREEWPPSLLRSLWAELLECESGRARSAAHEARWLNLTGFSLRPGTGVALDDWRVAETWKRLNGKLYHPNANCLAEWRILWRRIAAGLQGGQQQALVAPVLASWRDTARKTQTLKPGKKQHLRLTQADAEVWRMMGACELLPMKTKIELGEMALSLLEHDAFKSIHNALVWSIGRIGTRQPLYGPLNAVVSPDRVALWLGRLLELPGNPGLELSIMQLSRRTHDRYRDISEKTRDRVLRWLSKRDNCEHLAELVREGGELADDENALVFGEALPVGLTLR